MKITSIQIKRGSKDSLIRVLRGDNKPKDGEPIWEIDTGKLKFGDGIHNYEDLEYFNTGDIEIEDALDGNILIYDAAQDKWVPHPLADNKSIEYKEDGLQLVGFNPSELAEGLSPIINDGKIGWHVAATQKTIDDAVALAEGYAYNASQSATNASISEGNASTYATQAERYKNDTAELISKKFWFGTRAEYETEIIGQGKLKEGTIYFIRDYDWETFPQG